MYKNLLARLNKLRRTSESGFTMSDLMVGASLTTLVVAGSGTAIASMMDASTTANAKSERRVEMNRALEFMSTEVSRASELIDSSSLPSDLSDALADSSLAIDAASAAPVLQLTLPGGTESVTYFTADSGNGSWRGPKVLYRWGPKFSSDGNYENPGHTADWTVQPLLDRLEDFTSNVSNGSVQLNPSGQIKKLLGRKESYSLARHTSVAGGYVAAANFTPTVGANGTGVFTPLFTRENGDVVVKRNSTMKISFLGGEITCGAGGPTIPTQAKISLSGGTSKNSGWIKEPSGDRSYDVAPDTKLNLEGWAKGDNSSGSCKNFSRKYNSNDDQGTQVLTLVDGDVVPEFRPFAGQRAIDAFMQNYIDTNTGKVTLDPNQVIFLYELGTTNSGSSAYDMQDMVVLATVTPTETETTTSTTTETETETGETTYEVASKEKCDNGLGNGSDGCTPGKARPNDEIVRDAAGNIVCTPAPGSPCTQASKAYGSDDS